MITGTPGRFFPPHVSPPTRSRKLTNSAKRAASSFTLPNSYLHSQAFNIYMDNYFSNIPLFIFETKGIGICGTVRTNSSKFPKVLKVDKNAKPDWNTKSGVIVDDVLAAVWVDNGAVTMLRPSTSSLELNGKWSAIGIVQPTFAQPGPPRRPLAIQAIAPPHKL